MKILSLLTLLAILMLSGCTSKNSFVESVSYLPIAQPSNYRSNGVLILLHNGKKNKIRFKWRRQPQYYSIGLYGPLGIKLKTIEGDFTAAPTIAAPTIAAPTTAAPTIAALDELKPYATATNTTEVNHEFIVIDNQQIIDSIRTANFTFKGKIHSLPHLLDQLIVNHPKINDRIMSKLGQFSIKKIQYWKHAGVKQGVLPRSIELEGNIESDVINLELRFNSHRLIL